MKPTKLNLLNERQFIDILLCCAFGNVHEFPSDKMEKAAEEIPVDIIH